ncbi:hypothetical protein [Prosthecobacter sp.]|uniref:hypothetical protein n=1 Tax=Prosthecobacter sp. TaxID=1965333 RepID=UPI001DAA00F2|nr:hypothetical protein [Prosthecobacter sp.]MCB1275911.1 hypothetical protein [Prosthecobacter sp.]
MKRFLITSLAVISTAAASLAEDTTPLEAAGLTFQYPSAWTKSATTSMMRVATLEAKVEGAEKPLEVAFFSFGAAGGVKANVDRWLGQFAPEPKAESKVEEIDAGGTKVTLVAATGTYNDGPPMGAKTPKADYTLLGAIIPAGENNVFIKLTGPKDAVAKLNDIFRKLATSPFAK